PAGRVQERAMAGGLRPGHIERALARVRAAWEAVGAAPAQVVAGDDGAGADLLTLTVPPGHPPGAAVLAAAGFIPARSGRGRYVSADPASRLALPVGADRLEERGHVRQFRLVDAMPDLIRLRREAEVLRSELPGPGEGGARHDRIHRIVAEEHRRAGLPQVLVGSDLAGHGETRKHHPGGEPGGEVAQQMGDHRAPL